MDFHWIKEPCRAQAHAIKRMSRFQNMTLGRFLQAQSLIHDQRYFFEEHGQKSFYELIYRADAHLIFGRESTGLPRRILRTMEDRIFHIPMRNPAVKSLNLSNAASAVIYQALRPQFQS